MDFTATIPKGQSSSFKGIFAFWGGPPVDGQSDNEGTVHPARSIDVLLFDATGEQAMREKCVSRIIKRNKRLSVHKCR